MVNCPFCNSPRIISARHDSDWGGGNSIGVVNKIEVYAEGDLTEDGDVYSFGDIDILVCLGCDYTWQRYGNFRPTQRVPDICPECAGSGKTGSIGLPRECPYCDGTGKRR